MIGMEGISILENLSIMGIKMPKKIKNILEKLKDEEPKWVGSFYCGLKSVEYAKRTKHKTTRYAGEEIKVVQKNTNPI